MVHRNVSILMVYCVKYVCAYTLSTELSPLIIFFFQLVSNAIQFLASVSQRPNYKHLFEDQVTLQSICEKVIVPNMEFRGINLIIIITHYFYCGHSNELLLYLNLIYMPTVTCKRLFSME